MVSQRIDWAREEVEATVADYLRMLTLELNGQHYNKTEHRRNLVGMLNNRSHSSVEFKHQNISAALIELGYPPIKGYKPAWNYQGLILEVLEEHLLVNEELHAAIRAAVEQPATTSDAIPTDQVWVERPTVAEVPTRRESPLPQFSPVQRDYLAQEARNRSLGKAGEEWVAALEAKRLHEAGKKRLAARVEHVASTQGDGLGYDVLSFELDGKERLIEVKTTTFGKLTPFYVSRNEIARSEADAEVFHLYRVFEFRERPRLFGIPGSITKSFDLQAVSYLARLAGWRNCEIPTRPSGRGTRRCPPSPRRGSSRSGSRGGPQGRASPSHS